MIRKPGASLTLAVFLMMPSLLYAADYSVHPVNFIVAYEAGGGSDVSARLFSRFLAKAMKHPVAVVNRPGQNGEVGFSAIMAAKPDGQTIGMINLPVFFINPSLRATAYGSLDNFTVLAPLGGSEHTIGVAYDSPIRDINDLITMAKMNPGKLTISSSGSFSDDYLSYLMFEKQTGIKLTHIPFRGTASARAAVLEKHVDLIAFNVDESLQFVRDKKIRLLGIMADKRHVQLPDVPTFKELGYPVISSSTRACVGPKGISAKIRSKLVAACKSALSDPEYINGVKAMGQTFLYKSPTEYEKELQNDEIIVTHLLQHIEK